MASLKTKKKSYPLIPEGESTCVWMATGLISYKLCDRNYRCESCLFDQAIRNEESGLQEWEDDGREGPVEGDAFLPINGSIFYHPDHCWVKVESPDLVRIGIDDLLSQLITHIKVVILPHIGSVVSQGEGFAHIIQEEYIIPVVSPLSGFIQTVNPHLRNEPGLITADPRGEGWLITIRPENLEGDLKNLLFGRKALLWYLREEKEILARTDAMLNHHPEALGPTMQDGGARIRRLQDMLGLVSSKERARILDFTVTRPRKKV